MTTAIDLSDKVYSAIPACPALHTNEAQFNACPVCAHRLEVLNALSILTKLAEKAKPMPGFDLVISSDSVTEIPICGDCSLYGRECNGECDA